MENPQYEASLSMFHLIERDADVIFAGDSITARGCFSEFYPEQEILNRGIGSDTSEGVWNRLSEMEAHNPKAVFLMIGINDLGLGLPVDIPAENVKKIVDRLKKALPECTVYLESVLPAATVELETIVALNREYQNIADDYDNCIYVDLYALFVGEDGILHTNYLSADGVHLNGAGYQAVKTKLDGLVAFY